jgi:hypothetical protein
VAKFTHRPLCPLFPLDRQLDGPRYRPDVSFIEVMASFIEVAHYRQNVFIILMVSEALGSFETSAPIYQRPRPNLTDELNIQNTNRLEQAARMTLTF